MTDLQTNDNRLVLRDYPVALWAASSVFVTGAAIFVINSHLPWYYLLAVIVFELPMFLLFPALVITADRQAQTLTLEYLNPLRKKETVIPFRDLAEVNVERQVSRDSEGTSTNYRLQAVLRDGKTVPFRAWLSGSRSSKERIARQLNDFIGLRPAPDSAFETIGAAGDGQVLLVKGEPEDELVFEAADDEPGEQRTDGVAWKLEQRGYGGPQVTGWTSLDFRIEDGFLYLAQTMPGQNEAMAGGVMKKLGDFISSRLDLFGQSMKIYGIDPAGLPGINAAEQIELEPRLRKHFMGLTNDTTLARQLLNPWTSMPLAAWAEKYPLTQGANNQLVMLISPYGLYLGAMGVLNPARQAELAALGVEIVKAQSSKF